VISLLRESNVLPLLAGRISALAREHRVPGAQLAIHHDDRIAAIQIGELEYRTGRGITRESAFPIGSISKSFTATMAMILVADDDLELDAPIGLYLSGLDELGSELTLRHLLSHTSGLACGPDSDEVSTTSTRRYVAGYCRRQNLVVPPGTAFSYSNMGYVLAGHLIETITGMTWWEAMESILLRPLGIAPAFVGIPGLRAPARPVAAGHSVNRAAGRTRSVHQSMAPAEAPTGSLAVSAVDLVALGLLHTDPGRPELLEPAWAQEMRRPVAGADPTGLADGWGLGLATFGGGWVGHDGNANGTACYLRVHPTEGWVVAFTSNANTGFGLWRDLLDELARTNVPIGHSGAWTARARPTTPPPGCAGTYTNGDVEYVVAVRHDAQLHLAVDGDNFARLSMYEDLTFSTRDPDTGQQVLSGCFLRNPVTKHIDALQVGGRLAGRRRLTHDAAPRLIA
jgi:CubicO group peptidase (beta-lactamase class C family)